LTWIIIRTDHRKEHYVARRIRDTLGYDAWVPCQMIASRPAIARRVTAKGPVPIKELPLLPKRLFVRMDYPAASVFVGIRHLEEVERDGEERIITIPDSQIAAFRAAIDALNVTSLALGAAAKTKMKKQWKPLQEGLKEEIERAKQQIEEAA
jgi:hypothetical protein